MQQHNRRSTTVDDSDDGIFWMSYNDWFTNFHTLYLCRFFGEEYTEVFFESEWSKAKNTAGGCLNYDTFPNNPQMAIQVTATGD